MSGLFIIKTEFSIKKVKVFCKIGLQTEEFYGIIAYNLFSKV